MTELSRNENAPKVVTISTVELPEMGRIQSNMRTTETDKKEMIKAANILGISLVDLMRMASINMARAVIAEVKAKDANTFRDAKDTVAVPEAG